jgi:bisphosphoglycerate-dependent phosphoglycerate mutase
MAVRLQLWVVRHGETEDNKTRTIAGHNAGKLSALGVAQVCSNLFDSGQRALEKRQWVRVRG